MSNGSHNDEEAGRGEDRFPFPVQESGDAQPAEDHFRSFVDQETYFNPRDETQPPNSPPGVFYSIRLPPSGTTNIDYHSIRSPNTEIHYSNYVPHQGRSNDVNDVDYGDDIGHSDLSASLLGSYDAGSPNLGEVSLGDGNLRSVPVDDNANHLELDDELYAIGPAALLAGENTSEIDQTWRKSICSVVSEGLEVMAEEDDIDQTVLPVNPPAVESTVSQGTGEQNENEIVIETVPGLAASTSGYQTGTDADPGNLRPADNVQTLVKRDNQEPTQHTEQHLQAGPADDLQDPPALSPVFVLVSQITLPAQRNQEPQTSDEMDEDNAGNNV